MIPRWFDRLSILTLLLVGVVVRVWDLPTLPPGFSQEEIVGIDIIQQVQGGAGQVFFRTSQEEGEESFYHILNAGVTELVGDGLIGYRILSVWAGLLTLAFLYRGTRWLFGPGIALVAVAIMVTNIEAVMLSRSATRLSLTPLVVTASLTLITWTFRLYEPIRPTRPLTLRYSALGYLVGAALYVHYTGLFLGAVLVIFILYLWQTRQPVSRQIWSSCLFALTLMSIVTLPYIISFLRNPQISGIYILWKERPENVPDLLKSFFATLGALFIEGDSSPTQNIPSLPLLWPFWSILVLIGLATVARRWREPHFGLILIALIVGLLPDIWIKGGPDFRAMMILLPVMCILGGVGAYTAAVYVRYQRAYGGIKLVAAVLLLGFGLTGWRLYQDYLIDWPERQDVRLAYHANLAELMAYLDRSDDPLPTLVCTGSLRERADGGWADPQIAETMLHREDINVRYADCRTSFVLINGGKPMQILLANPKEPIGDAAQQWLNLAEILPVDPFGSVMKLDAEDELAQFGGRLQLEMPLLYPALGGTPETVTLPVRFGRNITLVGYRAPDISSYKRGDVVQITTYWRVDGRIPDQLGFFTRLNDNPETSPFTEVNVIDVLSTHLRIRDVMVQASLFTVPETLPPGAYVVTLGAYDNNTLNQIPVFSQDGKVPRGSYLMLASRLVVD